MQKEEARIAAHVCGDGWLYSYLQKNSLQIVNGRRYKQKRMRYVIGYCNNEKTLLKQFEDDMTKIFNIKAVKVRTELRYKSKRIYIRIKELGGGRSRDWFIGKEILTSSKEVKKEWIKAFFDDESTVTKNRSISVTSVNLDGLRQLKKLLDEFFIESHINQRNITTWYLYLNKKDALRYFEVTGFDHPSKDNKMRL